MRPILETRACGLACAVLVAMTPQPGFAQILTKGDQVQTGAESATPSPAAPAAPTAKLQRSSTAPAPRTPRPTRPPANPNDPGAKVGRCVGGAIAGGLFAGVLVSALGGSSRQVNQAIAAGAGAGCALGYNWTPRDKQAFDDASQQVFDDPQGQQHELITPDSKERLILVNTGSTIENRELEFQHFDNVASPTAGSRVIARPYRTTTALRLRSAPDDSDAVNIVGRFDPAEIVEVVALTPDGRWAMIGEEGVIVGYASMSGLAPLEATQTLRRTTTAKARPDTQRVAAKGAAPPAAAPARGSVQTARLVASTQCKSLVATSGQQQKKEAKGCSAPGGKWLVA